MYVSLACKKDLNWMISYYRSNIKFHLNLINVFPCYLWCGRFSNGSLRGVPCCKFEENTSILNMHLLCKDSHIECNVGTVIQNVTVIKRVMREDKYRLPLDGFFVDLMQIGETCHILFHLQAIFKICLKETNFSWSVV